MDLLVDLLYDNRHILAIKPTKMNTDTTIEAGRHRRRSNILEDPLRKWDDLHQVLHEVTCTIGEVLPQMNIADNQTIILLLVPEENALQFKPLIWPP
jgi:hypothetical protein